MTCQQGAARRGSAVLVLVALLLIPLLGMAAFAVDLGVIVVVRGELQNAADAAALAGAAQLDSQEAQLALYYAAERETLTQVYYTGDNAARREAQTYAQAHRAGGVAVVLDKNLGNLPEGDVALGYLSPYDARGTMTFETYPYNAVQVRTSRDAGHAGSLNLFFAPVFGLRTKDVAAQATAMLLSDSTKVMPITMHIEDYRNLLNYKADTGETDNYTYNPDLDPASPGDFTNRVSGGSGSGSRPDLVPEFRLYPDKGGNPGNFGTVDLGAPSGSATDLRRQIESGLSPADVAALAQQGKLTDGRLVATESAPIALSGDTGVSWTIEESLQKVIGQARTIPLYNKVGGTGTGAEYTIVGFVNVVVLFADNGEGGGKRVLIQPIAPFKVLSSPAQNGLGGVGLVR